MHRKLRTIAAMGFLGCATIALLPIGCGGIEQAPPAAHPSSDGPRIPAITEERLRECVKEYADKLEERPYRINAKVQVNERTGQTVGVVIEGIPDMAGDFAACTRVALRDMAVPSWVLNMRPGQQIGLTNGKTVPRGNNLANPAILVEVLVALGEFAAENGGRVIVYTVAVEMVTVLAVAAVDKLAKRCRKVKEKCLVSCEDSALPTGIRYGMPFHKCVRDCMESAGCFYNPP